MKRYPWIRLRQDGVPKPLYQAACEIWPAGKMNSAWGEEFTFECFEEDEELRPVAQRIIKLCQDAGLPWSSRGVPGTYGHTAQRIYDENDLASADFLLLSRHFRQLQHEHERDAKGRLLLIASNAKPTLKIGRIWGNLIIISNSVRKLLSTGNFVGLEFGEVTLKGKSIYASKEPFWELRSSIVLPKMTNVKQFIHPGISVPEQFAGDYSKIIMISDPPYRTGEVHYRWSDLKPLGAFDIARTFENYIEIHPALIISQRCYQFFLQNNFFKNKLPLNVEPVRIGPK